MSDALTLVRANHTARTDKMGELREIDEKVTAEDRTYNDTEQGRIEELRSQLAEIDGRISAQLEIESRGQEIEQAANGLSGLLSARDAAEKLAAEPDTRTPGQRYLEAREAGASPFDRVHFDGLEMRAVLESDDLLAQPQRTPGIVGFQPQRTYLSDLLPHAATTGNSVEYVVDNTDYTSNTATEVAEAASKPEGAVTLAEVNDPVRTIAVWQELTRQAAEDAGESSAYIDTILRERLRRRLDVQLAAGNGTAPNIKGMGARAGILTVAPAAQEDAAVSIRKALTAMEQADSVGEIIVMNPADAEIFDLTHYATAGLTATPNVSGPSSQTAWGLRQIRMPQIASGTALVIDPTAVMVRDRMQPSAYITDSHSDRFVKNILTLLLELRVALQVFRPKGICKITFDHDA